MKRALVVLGRRDFEERRKDSHRRQTQKEIEQIQLMKHGLIARMLLELEGKLPRGTISHPMPALGAIQMDFAETTNLDAIGKMMKRVSKVEHTFTPEEDLPKIQLIIDESVHFDGL